MRTAQTMPKDARTYLVETVILGLFAASVVTFPGPLLLVGPLLGQALAIAFFGLWLAWAAKLYRSGRLS